MAKTFHLTVAKVGEHLFDGDAVAVTLPGSEGVFQILAEHEAFVTRLVPGEIRITDADGEVRRLAIAEGGIAEVSHHQATILL